MNWPPSIQHKMLNNDTLALRLKHWRALGSKVVFTNGCFDVLHAGHLALLLACKKLGDYVIVGLNSDRSVRALKGVSRPVNPAGERMALLAALEAVDAVIVFDEDTPERLIQAVVPDVLVKGGDYTESQIAGADFVRSHGGEVAIVPLVDGKSTTAILKSK